MHNMQLRIKEQWRITTIVVGWKEIKQKVDLSTWRLVVQKIDGVYKVLVEAGRNGNK